MNFLKIRRDSQGVDPNQELLIGKEEAENTK